MDTRIWVVQILEGSSGWADYALRTSYAEAVATKASQEDSGYVSRIVEVR